uniref:hypothetical protein n=1 Tax=Thalassoroseus pseudoceratinae TaxID=2713176 RepID=UPI00198045C9
NVSPLSCEPPAGGNGRLDGFVQPRASLVNCSGWLGPVTLGLPLCGFIGGLDLDNFDHDPVANIEF